LIDSVLAPPKGVEATAKDAGIDTLVRTLSRTDLLDTVEGLSDVTIFAPTDRAFDAADATLSGLSEETVKAALTYHVAKGVGYSSNLQTGTIIPTVNGKSLTVTIENGTVYINKAKVLKTDLLTKNGVIHVIDRYVNFAPCGPL
jgi:uncharacterized surface protein with fasciclin (FAS1) repeats